MKVRFFIREGAKRDLVAVNVRASIGKVVDVRKSLPIKVKLEDVKKFNPLEFKKGALSPSTLKTNKLLKELEESLNEAFLDAISNKRRRNKSWLEGLIYAFFEEPEEKPFLYLTDYIENSIEKLKDEYVPRTKKKYSIASIKNFRSTLSRLKEYEESTRRKRIKIDGFDLRLYKDFVFKHCYNENDLGEATVGNYIKNIKSFLRRAREEGYEVSPDIEHKDFYKPKKEETKKLVHIYLSHEEQNKIFDFEFENEYLSNARDWLIISCETALRIQDFLKPDELNEEGFQIWFNDLKENGYREGLTTKALSKKTGILSEIPLGKMTASILLKNNGLPRFISEQRYNEYIKEVALAVGLTHKVYGSKLVPVEVNGNKEYRYKDKRYPKYQLVTSHIGRRSFITNAYKMGVNKMSIMKVSGHKSEEQLENYIKLTSEDSFEQLQKLHKDNSGEDKGIMYVAS